MNNKDKEKETEQLQQTTEGNVVKVDLDKLIAEVRANIMNELKEENLKLLMSSFAELKQNNEEKQPEENKQEEKKLLDF